MNTLTNQLESISIDVMFLYGGRLSPFVWNLPNLDLNLPKERSKRLCASQCSLKFTLNTEVMIRSRQLRDVIEDPDVLPPKISTSLLTFTFKVYPPADLLVVLPKSYTSSCSRQHRTNRVTSSTIRSLNIICCSIPLIHVDVFEMRVKSD